MTYAYSASNAVLHKVNHIPHLEQNSLELPLASQLETHSNGKKKRDDRRKTHWCGSSLELEQLYVLMKFFWVENRKKKNCWNSPSLLVMVISDYHTLWCVGDDSSLWNEGQGIGKTFSPTAHNHKICTWLWFWLRVKKGKKLWWTEQHWKLTISQQISEGAKKNSYEEQENQSAKWCGISPAPSQSSLVNTS